jgi:4-phytase / acid phosphatase
MARLRHKRICVSVLRRLLLVGAVCLAAESGSAAAADSDLKTGTQEVTPPSFESPIFTVIVSRHGVRSFTSPPKAYKWPVWDGVPDAYLTQRGYDLIKLMGAFYGKEGSERGAGVNCQGKGVFVYADKDQRTLGTAQALVKGLCGDSSDVPIYHEPDLKALDPVFDATSWLYGKGVVDRVASLRAASAVSGTPPSTIVQAHAEDFWKLQQILDTRCPASTPPLQCPSITAGESAIVIEKDQLAHFAGPLATGSNFGENLFLEYAQCDPAADMTPLSQGQFVTDLAAAMRLHVLAYDVNARNAYNPLVRGGNLLAHIVAMLDKKIGRSLGQISTPAEVDQKETTLAILSGHDTELGALGGILQAHWNPGGGIVEDDMPPGSALVFDLFEASSGEYSVGLRYASMTLEQFRASAKEALEGGIGTTPVTFTVCAADKCETCATDECVVPLQQFESLAEWLVAQRFVDDEWTAPSNEPVVVPLADPKWTECH